MSTAHLRDCLKDFSITVIHDNPGTHLQMKCKRDLPAFTKCRKPCPTEIIVSANSGNSSKRHANRESRWESSPTKKSYEMDLPPVLARRLEGSTLTLASLHKPFHRRLRDRPPTFKRSTEKTLFLKEILDKFEMIHMDGHDEFTNDELALGISSTHTI